MACEASRETVQELDVIGGAARWRRGNRRSLFDSLIGDGPRPKSCAVAYPISSFRRDARIEPQTGADKEASA